MVDSDGLDEIIRRERVEVTNAFTRAATSARNEREFQTQATAIIEKFADVAGIELSLREEYTLFNGRADAVYNRFIIEYEPPGSLRETNAFRHNQHAIGQVKDYLEKLVRRERHKAERLAGVVFNGQFFIWVRQREASWYIDPPIKVDATSTERFLRTLCSLSTERALLPDNLVEDFGENTNVARRVLPVFYALLTENPPRRTEVLFKQWSQQFSEVCDYDQASKVNVLAHARAYGLAGAQIDAFRFFFCVHTYYAFLIKLLAVQIVHFYLAPKLGTDLKQAAAKSSDDLRKYLASMEDGGIFRQLGISNLMEGDFFGWYLDVWGAEMDTATRRIVETLANYAIDTLDIDPDSSRDLLKHLYQDLMPKALRHNLGEYYTPDWLAERTLGLLDGVRDETVRTTDQGAQAVQVTVYRGDPRKRLLDPACGSGTFLVMAIRRIKEFAWKNAIKEEQLLSLILTNVVGFDLNPLAVISARTNYLLALGDLMQHRGATEINIPVFLCDSVLTPSEGDHLFEKGVFTFGTSVGTFQIPARLVEARRIDELANLLEESVAIRLPETEFSAKVARKFGLAGDDSSRDITLLTGLFVELRKLDEEGINGIWARIIKNAFAPLFVGRFDFVAGNPPWINWEHLPEQYRRSIAPLWQRYDLFQHKGMRARLGSAKDDISVLMFYVSADQYLVDHGKIGFVITQTVFKTEGGGEGFRRFRCGVNGPRLRVIFVDDWSLLKPFEGAANKTAVIVAQRDAETRYPVSVALWRKKIPRSALPEDAPLEQIVYNICRHSQWVAEPIQDSRPESIWVTGRPRMVSALKRLVGPAAYVARKGVDCSANGCYWVERVADGADGTVVVSNLAEDGRRRDVDKIDAAVEEDLLYPLLRGREVGPFWAEPQYNLVLGHLPGHGDKAIPEHKLRQSHPKVYRFFKHFEPILLARKSYQKFLGPAGQPFYATFNTGDYTFAPYKVVWREQADTLLVAVIGSLGSRIIIPDHKLILIPFENETEALFVAGVLSTSAARCVVTFSMVTTQISTNVLKYVPVPKFDSANSTHKAIVAIARQAHMAGHKRELDAVARARTELDAAVMNLWGLTQNETDDMQASLKDIGID